MLKFLVDDQANNRINDIVVAVRCDNEVRCMPSSSVIGTIEEELRLVESFGLDSDQAVKVCNRSTGKAGSFRCCGHRWLVCQVPFQDMFTGKW